MTKRIFDLIVSFPLLLLLSPFFLVVALVIKLASPGPALYRAKRTGLNGEVFTMHKFRTMIINAGEVGPEITARNDPRIFTFGKLLRNTKIDELPQLYDVFRGRMSIVGPRPEDPSIVEKYYTHRQMNTLTVKPGMTSPAALHFSRQGDNTICDSNVVGNYVQHVLHEKLEMELAYISQATVMTDIKVLLETLSYVFLAFYGLIKKTLKR